MGPAGEDGAQLVTSVDYWDHRIRINPEDTDSADVWMDEPDAHVTGGGYEIIECQYGNDCLTEVFITGSQPLVHDTDSMRPVGWRVSIANIGIDPIDMIIRVYVVYSH
jgi:hypothetical protein